MLVLLALNVLKLLWSLSAVIAVLTCDNTNDIAEYPEIRASFLVILALIAFFCGAPSASTKFCARDATSTPEPAPKDEMSFCAAALLAFATASGVLASAADVPLLSVLADVDVAVVDEVAPVVAMFYLFMLLCVRLLEPKLEPINSYI